MKMKMRIGLLMKVQVCHQINNQKGMEKSIPFI